MCVQHLVDGGALLPQQPQADRLQGRLRRSLERRDQPAHLLGADRERSRVRIASHVVQDQPVPLREERTREEHLNRLGVEGERGARDRSHQMRELATRPRQLGGQRGPSPFAAQRLRETPRQSVGVARRASPVLGADVRRPERRELADGARPEGAQVHRGAQLQPGQAEAAREQPPRPPRVSQHAPHQVLRGLPTHLVQVVDEHEGARRVGEVDGARELLVGLAQPHQRVLGGVPSGAREGAQDRVVEMGVAASRLTKSARSERACATVSASAVFP